MAYLRKSPGSPYWIACYRDAAGLQRNKSTKQKREGKAQEVANELERVAREDAPTMAVILKAGRELMKRLGQDEGNPTIEEEFLSFLKLGDRSDSTKERYRQIAEEFLAHLGKGKARKLQSLTAGEIESFKVAQIAKGLAGKSINIKLKMIRSALSRAERAGRIEKNPALQVDHVQEQPAGRQDFELSQITALLRACKGFKGKKGADWHGLVMMCYYTGCRLSDAANLRAGDVHLDGSPGPFIEYTEKKKKRTSPKVKKTLHADLVSFLLSLPSGDDPNAFLFPHLAGRGTGGANGLSREFVKLMDAAGLERRVIRDGTAAGGRRIYNLSEHSLRHACVSQLQEAGVAEDLRMQIVGHEDKEVHRNYAHARNRAAAAVQALPSVLPGKAAGPGKGR